MIICIKDSKYPDAPLNRELKKPDVPSAVWNVLEPDDDDGSAIPFGSNPPELFGLTR
jgi:hypothetical protein